MAVILSPLEGFWYDRRDLFQRAVGRGVACGAGAIAVPVGRFEFRDDGAVAEVFEVRPLASLPACDDSTFPQAGS